MGHSVGMSALRPPSRTPPRPRRLTGSERMHVALVGFMGSGKSTVGQLLAERCGYQFVDLDAVIATKASASIPEIFKKHGEVGFRARERAALRQVLEQQDPVVVSTGGGTFVDPQMREALLLTSRTVYLETSIDALLARLSREHERRARPLLAGPDPAATMRRLLEERAPVYQESEYTVTTDAKTVDEVASEVQKLLDMRRTHGRATPEPRLAHDHVLDVRASAGDYRVELQPRAGAWITDAILRLTRGRGRVALISDSGVAPLHAEPLAHDLQDAGVKAALLTFAAGEASKTLATAATLYDALLDADFDRRDWLVAVGGGVVGDLTGFVASTFLRGVPYIQVPTTTLAAVDSSVGGKTAVNTPKGKNLVGTFYPPRGVLVAASHLATQERSAHAAGLVEALKMAATFDITLFETMIENATALLAYDPGALLPVLSRAVQLKADVVSRDERETSVRAVLNYGHTIGHAIEAGEQYSMWHGNAVAMGMIAEAEWAQTQGEGPQVRQQLERGLRALGAPVEWRHARLSIDALRLDKKRQGGSVQLPVVTRLGQSEMRTVETEQLVDFCRRGRNP